MSQTRASHRIQKQKGIDLAGFLSRYGTEEQCRETLYSLRWPDGFRCPDCESTRGWNLCRPLVRCADCGCETSLTAGTLFHCTKLPLATWFLGIYLFTQTKSGLSALEMKRHLGVNIKTAALMQHKLMEAVRRHESCRTLNGIVELEPGYIEIKPGRRSRRKSDCHRLPCLLAIERTRNQGVHRVCLDPVPSFRHAVVRKWAEERLDRETKLLERSGHVLGGTRELDHIESIAVDDRRATVRSGPFHWTRILRFNLISALRGVRHLSNPVYRARYLALFQFRLNYRHDMVGLPLLLVSIAAGSNPTPRNRLLGVESHGHSLPSPPNSTLQWRPT